MGLKAPLYSLPHTGGSVKWVPCFASAHLGSLYFWQYYLDGSQQGCMWYVSRGGGVTMSQVKAGGG